MRKTKLAQYFSITLLAFIFSGCAAQKELLAREDPMMLSPTERLIVIREADSVPMEVVKNDNPAGDHFLRETSKKVRATDTEIKQLVARMKATVTKENGVGIAAPQVGINRRAILVQRFDKEPEKPFEPFYNPQITSYSKETEIGWEGCLSIPAGYGKVSRSQAITVSYEDENGAEQTETIKGFTARILQHEIDHLNGILFIDRKEEGELLPKDEYKKMKEQEKLKESKEPSQQNNNS